MRWFQLVYASCCLASSAALYAANFETDIKTTVGAPVEDVAVILVPLSKARASSAAHATIEQRDREFVPYVTVVRTGTVIDFPNRDPFKHHLYSFSPAKQFEIKLYAGKPMQPERFDKPGAVALGCNIHDWMEAYVYVTDSPYFAKTDKQGKARIKNIPAGPYQLKLWHPRQKQEPPGYDLRITDQHVKRDLVFDITPRLNKTKPPIEADHY